MPYDLPIYEFDEENDLTHYKCWVLGAMWFPPPFVPLFIDLHDSFFKYGMQHAADAVSAPKSKGWDWRIYRGATYLTVVETNEEERKQREPAFRERMRKVLEDPWTVWEERRVVLEEQQKQLLSVDLKSATDSELAAHWWDVWHSNKYLMECHFYPMYALGQGNNVFRRVLKELHGIGPGDPPAALCALRSVPSPNQKLILRPPLGQRIRQPPGRTTASRPRLAGGRIAVLGRHRPTRLGLFRPALQVSRGDSKFFHPRLNLRHHRGDFSATRCLGLL